MHTLLLRLAGPLQSWGSGSKFDSRLTERTPTKSGVLSLAAAALGYKRDDPIDKLQRLKFAARVDQPGKIIKDFHTAHTSRDKRLSFISDRYYLSDAIFLAGLEGPRELLNTIEKALQNPVFPTFLGRRSCPPSVPLVLGIREQPLMAALLNAPWEASERYRRNQPKGVWLEIVRDAEPGEPGVFEMRDFPITFSQSHRQHVFRNVISDVRAVEIKNELSRAYTGSEVFDAIATKHDPFDELEADYVSVQD
ncbi:MAG: type I-E CRISPR-associated protein Cas5/CasD [Gracilibacteraceae bacterium]|jgi:CRISPR system Cascade subunit CasD|nr:type I-E CRISPR-associated protein Cas5/CasD [Gracilibacteraceae bacterium]